MNKFKNIMKWVGLVLSLVAVFVLSIAAIKARHQSTTSGVHVEITNSDLKFITAKQVDKLVEAVVDSVDTMLISEINLQELEEKIEKNEYVENCDAFINNKEGLEFQIQQKRPIYRVIHENGVSYYVDNQGIKFSLSPTFTANVPIATGKIVYDVDSLGVQHGIAINDLLKLFEFTQQNDFANALVTSVNVEPNGDYVFSPRTGQHVVNLGKMDDLDEKFDRLTIFYQEGLNKVGWNQYSEVSLKFKNQIIAKKK